MLPCSKRKFGRFFSAEALIGTAEFKGISINFQELSINNLQ